MFVKRDDEVARDIKMRLEGLGYSVTLSSSSVAEAVKRVEKYRPDLVLLDAQMQGDTDGGATAAHIHRLDIPIVFLAARTDPTFLERANGTRPSGYVLEPFATKELHASIEMGLYAHRLERELKNSRQDLTQVVDRQTAELQLENDHLRESEKRFRDLVETAGIGIVVDEIGGDIIYLNDTFVNLLGYDRHEMTGVAFQQFVHPDDFELGQKLHEERLEKGLRRDSYDVRLVKKDGSIVIVNVDVSLLQENGKIVGARSYIRDITEARRLQQSETRSQRLEAAGLIAGQVAHDFNNLLARLMSYPDLIRAELGENHSALPYLDGMERSARRIADINQQLLSLGRRGQYNMHPLNLNEIVSHVITDSEPLPETLVLKTNLCHDLMNIMGGAAQLHRILSNLLDNARDATQNNGIITIKTENMYIDETAIGCSLIPRGEYVKLTVSDTGCGISQEALQQVFDPFYTTKKADKKRGSGLGLSVVDSVVRDHGGFIDLSAQVGERTSFFIYFPMTRESQALQNSAESCGGSEAILFVDDDDTQREVSTLLLKKLGYTANTAASGEKAIEFLRENPQDLVILDMVMPGGIDGTETYRRILEISPLQKAIIMSGFSDSDRIREARRLGAGAFVEKPVTMQFLAAAVRAELDRPTKCLQTF